MADTLLEANPLGCLPLPHPSHWAPSPAPHVPLPGSALSPVDVRGQHVWPPSPSPDHRGLCPVTVQSWRPAFVCVLPGAPRTVSSAGLTEALGAAMEWGKACCLSSPALRLRAGRGRRGRTSVWPGSPGLAPRRPRPEDPQVRSCPLPLSQLSSRAPPARLRPRREDASPPSPLTGSTGLAGPAEWGVQPPGPRAPAGLRLSLLVRQAALGRRQASAVCRGRGHAAGAVLGLPAPGASLEGFVLGDQPPGGSHPRGPARQTPSRGTRLVGLQEEAHTAQGPSLLLSPQVEPGPSRPTPHPSSLPSPGSDSARQPRVQAVGPERGSLEVSCPLGACPGLSVHSCLGGALGRRLGARAVRGLRFGDRKALLGGAGLGVRKERPAGGWSERVPGEPPAGWGFSQKPTLGGTIRLWRRDGGVRMGRLWEGTGASRAGPAREALPYTRLPAPRTGSLSLRRPQAPLSSSLPGVGSGPQPGATSEAQPCSAVMRWLSSPFRGPPAGQGPSLSPGRRGGHRCPRARHLASHSSIFLSLPWLPGSSGSRQGQKLCAL